MMQRLQALIVIAGALLVSPVAYGAEATTIDMTQVLMDEQGQPARDTLRKELLARGAEDSDPQCHKCPILTLGEAIAHALSVVSDDDARRPPPQLADLKWGRFDLGRRVRGNKAATLNAEEVTVIKNQLALVYNGVVLAQAYPLLDPNAKPPGVKP